MLSLGGYYTCPLAENDAVRGFYLASWTGARQLFAHVDFVPKNTYSRFGVHLEVFDNWGNDLLVEALSKDLIVLDELGIMEQQAARFVAQVVHVFSQEKDVLAVIQQRALDFWLAHLSGKPYEIFYVDTNNRDALPAHISALLDKNT